jgi:hypothetical protein
MMRSKFGQAITLMLMFTLVASTPFAQAQNRVPTDDEIRQLRRNIEAAQREQPPPMYVEQHQKDIQALKDRLQQALKSQRAAMAEYLEHVRTLFPERVAQIESDIRAKDREIESSAASLPSSGSAPPTSVAPQANNNGTATSSGGNSVSAGTTGNGNPSMPPAASTQGVDDSGLQVAAEKISAILAEAAAAKKGGEISPCGLLMVPNPKVPEYDSAVCTIVNRINSGKATDSGATISKTQDFLQIQEIIAGKLIGKEERGKFLTEAEERRTDKQTGSGSSSSGTTSLVVKGGAPAVLGFAVENGGLTRTGDGTTVTFRGNPVGLFKALNNKTFDEMYLGGPNDWGTKFLKKTSFALSFDTSRGSTPGVFTADRQQLSSYSVRYEFKNDRDPRNPKHDEAFKTFLMEHGNDLAQAVYGAFKALVADVGGAGNVQFQGNKFKDAVLQAWFEETSKALAAAKGADVETTFKAQLDKFPTVDKLEAGTRSTIENFAQHFGSYLKAREKLMDDIAKGSVITFEYTNTRNVNSPNLSNYRFIAETGIFGGKADLTANASLTTFDSRPAGITGRVRDFQFAGQLDAPINVSAIGSFVFSFAGKYERAVGNVTALDGTVLPNTKGDIAVGQVKLTIPIKKGSGVSFPISFSFANRTELLKEKDVRGHIGFTFDLDKIFAKFKPF